MNNKDVIKQYANKGILIPEYQMNKLNPNLLKTYLRKRILMASEHHIQDYELNKMDNGHIKMLFENNDSLLLPNNIFEKVRYFSNIDTLHLDVSIIPDDVVFENITSLYFPNLFKLPEPSVFNNVKNLNLTINKISNYEFNNRGLVSIEGLTFIENVKFNNKSLVNFERNTTILGKNVIFNNDGDIRLNLITEINNTTQFNNKGSIGLNCLETIPENFMFNNKNNDGYASIFLGSVKNIPSSVIFNNNGNILLPKSIDKSNITEEIYQKLPRIRTNGGNNYLCKYK